MKPDENDVVIIGISQRKKITEIAAKSSSLHTAEEHEKH